MQEITLKVIEMNVFPFFCIKREILVNCFRSIYDSVFIQGSRTSGVSY